MEGIISAGGLLLPPGSGTSQADRREDAVEGRARTSDGAPACAQLPRRPPTRRKKPRRQRPAALSVTQPPTLLPLPIGHRSGPAPFQPLPQRTDRPRGGVAAAPPLGGRRRARPAVSYGGSPAGGRALAGYLVARLLTLAPSRRLWGSRGRPSGRSHRLAPIFSLVPSRPACPRVVSSPRRVRRVTAAAPGGGKTMLRRILQRVRE